MSHNLSATIPAPPLGAINIIWQADGNGNISGYVPFNDGVVYLDDAAGSVGGYKSLISTFPTTAEATLSASGSGVGVQTLIGSFISSPLALSAIPTGEWVPSVFASVDALTQNPQIVYKLYTRTSGGVETLQSTLTANFSTTAILLYDLTVELPQITVATTDMVVLKVYLQTQGASSRTATIYYDGSTHVSHINGPFAATGGSATPGGSNTQIQYNNSGAFGGAAGLTWTSGSSLLTVPNISLTGGFKDSTGSLGVSTNILSSTGSATQWTSLGSIGGGTVSNFSAGNLSPLFTTSVATPTTTPALSFTLSTQSANLVFAGPTTGAAAAPTFRSLVDADIPATLISKTLATNVTISGTLTDGFASVGTSGFVLSSTNTGVKWISPNATAIQGVTISSNTPITGDLLVYNQYGDSKWDVTGGYRTHFHNLDVNQSSGSAPSWYSYGSSASTTNVGTITKLYPTSTEGMGIKCTTAATATSYAGNYLQATTVNGGHYNQGSSLRRLSWRASHNNNTSCRYWMGLHNGTVSTGTVGGGGAGQDTWTYANAGVVMWRFSTVAGDANWKAYVGTAAGQTIVDTGVTIDTSGVSHLFELAWDGTAWNFFYDGVVKATISTNVPPAGTTVYTPLFQVDNAATTTTPAYGIYWWQVLLK